MPLWSALESGVKRAVAIWHRRAGKDTLSVNWTVREALRRPGLYWHILPTLTQGRKIVWNGMSKEGRSFLDYFPPEVILRRREDEMTIWLEGGSIWQVVGTEDVDRLVGANPVGVVFSEYSLQDPRAWSFIRPILAENGGWALFIFTPRGRNHGYKLLQQARKDPDWFAEVLTVEDTHAIPAEAIEAERRGMPKELFQQEYFCSFDAPLVGSYYGDLLTSMREEGRIKEVPWNPLLPVRTGWDLGVRDSMVIWFAQRDSGGAARLIDCYHNAGKGLAHYAKILKEKPYSYDYHFAPHDAQVTEMTTGKSRVEMAAELGIHFDVLPRMPIQDGIDAVRALLPRVYADAVKCDLGLEALKQYRKDILEGAEGPDGEPIYRDKPHHDWTSNFADALRTLAVGWTDFEFGSSSFKQPDVRWVV